MTHEQKMKILEDMASKAGYTLGMIIVPNKCYTLTNILSRKKYKLKVSRKVLFNILEREIERLPK
jgi:hypothetical protein